MNSFYFPLPGLALCGLGQFFLVQRDNPSSLLPALVFYSLGFFFLLSGRGTEKTTTPSKLSLRWESLLFASICLIALLLRLYRLDQFPAGIFLDEGCIGWGAMKIAHEGWRPFAEINSLLVRDPLIYYLAAFWFRFFPNTQFNMFLLSVFFSLLAFPLIYWTFRQLSGAPQALLALFILAVMRWHITYSRFFHPAIQILIYIFGALSFWLYALKTGKSWAFLSGALFLGAGAYTYQAYKIFPLLMAIYFAYEFRTAPSTLKTNRMKLAGFFLVAAIISAPIWVKMLAQGSLGKREEELAFFPSAFHEPSPLTVIGKHFLQTALMFNREGDPWYIHNLPLHRMLDDVTGIFFILGFFGALIKIRERKYFYPAVGFAVMCLPAALSVNAAHASRAFGATPFIAWLAAAGLTTLVGNSSLPPRLARVRGLAFIFLLLFFMAAENYWVYFERQAKDFDCWKGASIEATTIGKTIAQGQEKNDYYLSSRYFGNYVVEFLAFNYRDRIHEWKPSNPLVPAPAPGKGLLFALEEGQTGTLNLLQSIYPGGETKFFRDPRGHALVYFYSVPASPVQTVGSSGKRLDSNFGLQGTYVRSPDWNARPSLVQTDFLINFTFRNDFPLDPAPPLSIRWKGWLETPRPGNYQFAVLTTDQVKLTLGGKKILSGGSGAQGWMSLKKGEAPLEVFFQKASGTDAALSLLWQKPGDAKFEVIPFSAYRRSP